VRGRSVDSLLSPEIFPKQLSGLPRSVFGRIEIMLHGEILRRTKNGKCTAGNAAELEQETPRVTNPIRLEQCTLQSMLE